MSHFSVLVIGDDVDGQLAPYHEFECTGTDDQYVQTIDKTTEARAEYESQTSRRLRDPDGDLHDPYDDRFYRDPTEEESRRIGQLAGSGGNGTMSWHSKDWQDGLGYRTKVHFVPEGWEEVEVPTSEVETFAEWASGWYGGEIIGPDQEPDLADAHKYGWIRVDSAGEVLEVIDRTNPNKRWDWYEIGGRWDGFFWSKSGASVNHARKGEIDFDAMRREAVEKAEADYLTAHAAIAGRPVPDWQEMIGDDPTPDHLRAMREEHNSNPVVEDLRRAGFYSDVEQFAVSLDEYKRRAADRACRTFAVVKDSQWYERGSMGWFGCVSGEVSDEEWSRRFSELVDGLPDETLLTVVDCHI